MQSNIIKLTLARQLGTRKERAELTRKDLFSPKFHIRRFHVSKWRRYTDQTLAVSKESVSAEEISDSNRKLDIHESKSMHDEPIETKTDTLETIRGSKLDDPGPIAMMDNNEELADESDNSSKKTGRKEIRKILDFSSLTEETLQAMEHEATRRKEIEVNRQRHSTAVRVLVNPAHGEDEPDILMPEHLLNKLKPHQIEAVQFLWENIVSFGDEGSGCLLAHEMGLGKTLSTIAFLHMYFEHSRTLQPNIPKVLIIMPTTVLHNWKNEFYRWLPVTPNIFVLDPSVKDRHELLNNWNNGGILLVGYELFRILATKQQENITMQALCEPGPDLVVVDEAHRIKNPASGISIALKHIKTKKRISLTGYPLQNYLSEYWCMIDFIKPSFLGTRQEFKNMFENPINNGKHADSTVQDVLLSKKRAYVLHKQLQSIVHRRDSRILRNALPPKHEFVISCKMSLRQTQLSEAYIQHYPNNFLVGFNILSLIGNHPHILKEIVNGKGDDALSEVVEDSAEEEDAQVEIDNEDEDEDEEYEDVKKKQAVDSHEKIDFGWIGNLLNEAHPAEETGKMTVLKQLLKEARASNEKTVVFTKSIPTLNHIEKMAIRDGYTFRRLDGSTPHKLRQQFIDEFNDESQGVNIFLVSTKAGGLGVNLTGASRLVLFDVCWNPCHDVQAAVRVYRYGQAKPTYIYRLQNVGTIEEKVYKRQITKEGLSKRVVDSAPASRLFTAEELGELMKLEIPNEKVDLAKKQMDIGDELLRNVLEQCGQWIHDLKRHDTLLLPDEKEVLDDSLKNAAEEEYQESKKLFDELYKLSAYANTKLGQINAPESALRKLFLARAKLWKFEIATMKESHRTDPRKIYKCIVRRLFRAIYGPDVLNEVNLKFFDWIEHPNGSLEVLQYIISPVTMHKLIKGNKTHRILEIIHHKVHDALVKHLKRKVSFGVSLCGKKDEELIALKTSNSTASSKIVVGKIFKDL